MIRKIVFSAALLIVPMAASAQGGAGGGGITQGRDGLAAGSKSQNNNSSNSLPTGAINAETGPQAHPAYSSGASTTPNPGEAFVRTTPVPSSGGAQSSPGTLSTTTVSGNNTATKTGGPGVGEAGTPPK